MPRIFPVQGIANKGIHVSGVGARSFSVLMADIVPCLDSIEKGQFFPESLYDDMPPALEGVESREQRAERVCLTDEESTKNLVICLNLSGSKGFSVMMSDCVPDLHMIGDTQCFPMFLYETEEGEE